MTTIRQRFDRAAKRSQKLNAKLAAGDGDEKAAVGATERLWDLLNDPETRGLDESERAPFHDRVSALHLARVAASEAGRRARANAREIEARRLRAEERVSRPIPGSYDHEIAIMRGRS